MDEEIWKPVIGYESTHEVSNLGRVRSIDRIINSGSRWGRRPERRMGKVLSQAENDYGYLTVRLNVNKKYKTRLVHRLVAMAFIGEPPEGQPQVNHKDGDKHNNSVNNLEWVSNRENALHKFRTLGYDYTGKIGQAGKLIVCVDTGDIFRSAAEAVRKFGGTNSGLLYALARDNKKYRGREYMYKNIEKGK